MSDGADCPHLRVLISGSTCSLLLTSSSPQRVPVGFDRFRCLQWKNKCWCPLPFVVFALSLCCCSSPAASRWLRPPGLPPTRRTHWPTSPTSTTASSPRCWKLCRSTGGRGGTPVWRKSSNPSTGTWNIWRRFTRSPPECRGMWTGAISTTLSDWSSHRMSAWHKVTKVSKSHGQLTALEKTKQSCSTDAPWPFK